MKKVYVFFLAAAIVFGPVRTLAQVSLAWATSYGSAGNDYLSNVATDGSGNVYISGTENTSNGATVVKYNSLGSMIWRVRYVSSLFPYTYGSAMAVDNSGNVYVAGRITNNSQSALVAVKYNTNGAFLWATVFDSSAALLETPVSIKLDAAGNVYVAGSINSSLSDYDYLTVKFNAAGVRQWARTYSGPGTYSDFLHGLAVDAAGNAYVTGMAYLNLTRIGYSYDYVTVKYNTSGATMWTARYSYLKAGYDRGNGIGVDASGNVYVTGYSAGSGTAYDYATLKYSPVGVVQWVQRFNGPGNLNDYANAMSVDGAGNVYVTGQSQLTTSNTNVATVKYNTAGAQVWTSQYDAGSSYFDVGNAIGIDAFGSCYVTGDSYIPGVTNSDVITLKYTSSGALGWGTRYNNYWNGSDYAKSIAVYSPASIVTINPASVYVGGQTNTTSSTSDFLLVKYSQPRVIAPRDFLTATFSAASQVATPAANGAISEFRTSVLPNPVQSTALISYDIPYQCDITLTIYDVQGREVDALVSGPRKAGRYQSVFAVGQLPSQLYYYTLVAKSPLGDYKETKPMVVRK